MTDIIFGSESSIQKVNSSVDIKYIKDIISLMLLSSSLNNCASSDEISLGPMDQINLKKSLDSSEDQHESKSFSYLQKILSKRSSWRGTIGPISEDKLLLFIERCNHNPQYRPFGVPGCFKLVTLFPLTNLNCSGSNLGEEKTLLNPIKSEEFRKYLHHSFLERQEIEERIPSIIAVGINISPLLSKYSWMSLGLLYSTLGGVLNIMELVSVELGLKSTILFGVKNPSLWSFNGRNQIIIPAAIRVGT